jgi:hypothetical protein
MLRVKLKPPSIGLPDLLISGAELSYGKVWQFSAIIFLESLYTMNRLRNIKFGCYKVWVAGQR